jgi:hypothetical protein
MPAVVATVAQDEQHHVRQRPQGAGAATLQDNKGQQQRINPPACNQL